MTVAVTLELPERFIEQVRRFGGATQQRLEDVLTDVLEIMVPMLEATRDSPLYPSVLTLPDAEVVQLADAKMDVIQNERLGVLQSQGKAMGLSAAERCELLALLQIYQLGQLRKSEALAEAVRRGLRTPLPA
jgi:hypothetical protein